MSHLRRFIVLGCGRTGSNLLASMLNSHPNIRCMNELFNDSEPETIFWGTHARDTSAADRAVDLELRAADPIRFLEQRVFTNVDRQTRFIGFKIFYYHARGADWEPVWRYLQSDGELRVLHIKRRNRLRKHVSEKIAKLTDKWAIASDKDAHRDVRVKLWPKQCIESFERTIAQEEEAARFFRNHALLDVHYEDLATDPDGSGTAILDFLGARHGLLRQGTRRQVVEPLSSVIENYDELAAAFAGTPWAAFLDD
ncbi:MAG: sulfotransferase [Planctomycetes bacterium]|nr:sulfotransferase [Planctomycetota bacterium]